MTILFWILLIAVVSVLWALFALKKEKTRRELDEAKEDIAHGRVIFHSSDSSDSSASS